jgi:hypothetical protein
MTEAQRVDIYLWRRVGTASKSELANSQFWGLYRRLMKLKDAERAAKRRHESSNAH